MNVDNPNLEEELILKQFDLSRKKKIKKSKKKNKDEINGCETNSKQVYDYEYMLNKLYNNLKENNKELYEKNNKITILKIKSIIINKKTIWFNFGDFCASIYRDRNQVMDYINRELQTTSSIIENNNNKIKIQGRFTINQLQTIMMKFISHYVSCCSCKSLNTNIKKDKVSRLNFLYCNQCGSSNSIKL